MKKQEWKNCGICNKKFYPIKCNQKYCCPECKQLAKDRDNKISNAKQLKLRAEARKEAQRLEEENRIKRKQEAEQQRLLSLQEEEERAKAGDTLAALCVADRRWTKERTYENHLNYWKCWKAYELHEAEISHAISRASVNDISIHDDDFEEKVIESIKSGGRVCWQTYFDFIKDVQND